MKKLLTLLFLIISGFILQTKAQQQVYTNPASDSSTCNGWAQATVSSSWYNSSFSLIGTGMSVTNLCVGNYYCLIPNSNGFDTIAFTITIYDPCLNFTASVNTTTVSDLLTCDGTAQAVFTGGTAPYLFYWDNDPPVSSAFKGSLCYGLHVLYITDYNNCSQTVEFYIDTAYASPCPNPPSVTITGDSLIYVGKTAYLNAYAPTATTYSWSTGAVSPYINVTPTVTTSYTVYVVDNNNCSNSAIFTVQVLDNTRYNPCYYFMVNIDSIINETYPGACNGIAYVTPFYGTAPYTYEWGQVFTTSVGKFAGLCAGSFTVTVKDSNGCIASAVGYVETDIVYLSPCANSSMNVSIASVNSSAGVCDGSATVNVSGGTAPYTYTWSNGYLTPKITNLCLGYYYVMVTDSNGCTSGSTIFINGDTSVLTPLNVNIVTTNTLAVICDGSVWVNVTGGVPPYSLVYSNGSTGTQLFGLCSDIYDVTVKDANGQSESFTFVIDAYQDIYTNPTNPLNDSVIIATVTPEAFEDCSIDFNALDSILITNYFLDANDSLVVEWTLFSSANGDTIIYQYFDFNIDGVYELVLSVYCSGRATKGFVKAYDKVQVNNRLRSIKQSINSSNVAVYPNPFVNQLTIVVNENSNLVLTDLTGKQVLNQTLLTGENVLNTQNLAKGIYLVNVVGNNSVQTFKVIRN